MRKFSGVLNVVALVASALLCVPPETLANYSCPNIPEVKDSICDSKYSSPQQQSQKMQCKEKCQQGQQACKKAQATCQAAMGKEAGDIASGQNATSSAGNGAGSNNAGDMGSAGSASCAGQDANNNRANDGKPIQPAMQDCDSQASQCEDPSGPAAGKAAQASGAQNAAQMAQRSADAAKMGQDCKKDDKNQGQMPSMSPPQMPQQSPQQKADNPQNTASEITQNTEPSTGTNTNSETSQIAQVNFGDGSKNGDVKVKEPDKPSGLSGSQASGPNSFNGSTPGLERNNDSFKAGGGMPFSNATVGGSGSGAGNLAGDKGASKDGIAPANIAPKEGDDGSVSLAGGSKSVLGLKGSRDDEEGAGAATMSKGPTFANGKGGDGKDVRGPAGGGNGSDDLLSRDATSIFMMVRNRYRNLRELGEI
jgi:hypothetical protein